MIVVADASPLNYFIVIGQVDVLMRLYARVTVPAGVIAELAHPASTAEVRSWALDPPTWVEVAIVDVPPDSGLEGVDKGEAEAIVLAERLRPDVLLIIDDRDGRRVATQRGLATTGTLGVLNDAAARGLVDLPEVIARLRETTFRASPALLQEMVERDRRRREGR